MIDLPEDVDVIVSLSDIIEYKLWNEFADIANKECITPTGRNGVSSAFI